MFNFATSWVLQSIYIQSLIYLLKVTWHIILVESKVLFIVFADKSNVLSVSFSLTRAHTACAHE